MIKFFFVQSLLTFLIFMIWILTGNFSGGEIGMTPLTVIITVTIQFVLAVVVLLSFKTLTRKVSPFILLISYLFIYEVCFFIFTGNLAIANIFNKGFSGAIYRGYSFSSLISGVITFIIIIFTKNKVWQIKS